MGSAIAEVSDAIKDWLNDGTWSESFVATRSYLSRVGISDLGSLRVDVVPQSAEFLIESRNSLRFSLEVGIGFRKKIATNETTECDGILSISQDVAVSIVKEQFSITDGSATCVSARPENLIELSDLDNMRVATHVLTVRLVVSASIV